MKEEIRFVQNKNEALEKGHIAHVKDVSDKPLDEHEITLQEFIPSGLKRTKLAYMIYGVSKSRGKGLGYCKKPFNPRLKP